jgi:hypothetical protein
MFGNIGSMRTEKALWDWMGCMIDMTGFWEEAERTITSGRGTVVLL